MKSITLIVLFSFCTGLTSSAQINKDTDYTGIEYLQLKSQLCRGWNTWNTNSVLSHVLLPEAISVDFYLKDKSTGKILKDALMGRRGGDSESILPVAHSNDGSYTELTISWKGIKMKIQSCAHGKDICFLLTPLENNLNGELLISPNKMWWDREGKMSLGKNQLIYDLPSGKIKLVVYGDPIPKKDSANRVLAFSAGSEIALSTVESQTVSDIRNEIAKAKAKHEESKDI